MNRMRDAARTVTSAASASWIRWALTLVILGVALWFALQNQDSVVDGWRTFLRADFGWVLFSAAMVALSLYSMAEVMRLLLRAADVPVTRRAANSLVLAANSWSVSVPGGIAFSTALQVRRQLKWGASPVVISWFILLSGALSFLGLATLSLGALFFIRGDAPVRLIAAGVAVLGLTGLLWWFSRNTAMIETVAKPLLKTFNAIRRKPAEEGAAKLRATIRQLTSVRLGPVRLIIVFAWSFTNWITDVICLYAAMRAVGVDDVAVRTVVMAFVFSKVAGFIQATPGGVGPVEAVLTGTLIASGMVGTDAVATVLIYRLVSFILPAAVGWIVYLVDYGGDRRKDVEADAADDPTDGAVGGAMGESMDGAPSGTTDGTADNGNRPAGDDRPG
ncbi:lysylphosphatidylglycerol synthase transmembrane domain-containing protein [Corynebacterium freneyi]|uniref:lysylphosphatidylglycerol synthase transmembrane domain-containing protein n=1 Tax=Corynebacterium freneyi TaxID=134034 RepID=UPI001EF1C9F7|nr:YbhN family protein [Corynebacterium freneyi]MCG7439457.1 YbhN family protein [Corynebacterium freneyi]